MIDDEIVPDDKDWTWVLDRPCPDCGFDAGRFDASRTGTAIRENAAQWREVLSAPHERLVERRQAGRWSDLEYAAHVRDVYRLYHERLALMLREDDPLFANWDQDRTAVDARYSEQLPTDVARELNAAAQLLADAFDGVAAEQWSRTGRRSDGVTFTIDSFARYLLHDPIHHLWDIGLR